MGGHRAALGLLVLTCAAGPAGAEEAPDLRLDAFRQSCVPAARSYAKTIETVAATGWTKTGEEAHPELQAMMGIVREQLVPDDDIRLSGLDLYRKDVGAHELFLVATEISADGIPPLVSCYVYDFDATAGLAEAALSAWLGAEPVERTEQPGVIAAYAWQNPPNLPSVEVRSSFIPESNRGALAAGFSGIGLSVSGFDETETDD